MPGKQTLWALKGYQQDVLVDLSIPDLETKALLLLKPFGLPPVPSEANLAL